MRRPIMIFAALASFIVYPTLASADMCFRYQKTGGGTLVVKGGKLPAVNTCEPLAMFESGGLAGAATGSICRDINDFTVIFHYTYDACIGPGHYFEFGDLSSADTKRRPPHGIQHLPWNACGRVWFL